MGDSEMAWQKCEVCHGTGQNLVGSRGSYSDLCPVCFGAAFVDPNKLCRCGRLATYESPKSHKLFCGRIACNPDAVKTVRSGVGFGASDLCCW
jgi:hypothetical protein